MQCVYFVANTDRKMKILPENERLKIFPVLIMNDFLKTKTIYTPIEPPSKYTYTEKLRWDTKNWKVKKSSFASSKCKRSNSSATFLNLQLNAFERGKDKLQIPNKISPYLWKRRKKVGLVTRIPKNTRLAEV